MATFAKVRSLSPALLFSLVLALSLAGIGVAHAAPLNKKPPVPPPTCFWTGPTNDFSLTVNGSKVGDYVVAAQHDTCNTPLHRALLEINITDVNLSCNTASAHELDLDANAIPVEFVVNPPSVSVGGSNNNCGGIRRTNWTVTTATYSNGSATYCAESFTVHYITSLPNLDAGSSCA